MLLGFKVDDEFPQIMFEQGGIPGGEFIVMY
jgi:hypothetical protein